MNISARMEGRTLRVGLHGDYKVPREIVLRWPREGQPARVVARDTEWTRFDEKGCRLSGMFAGEVIAEWLE